MPENGFVDNPADDRMNHWTGSGLTVTDTALPTVGTRSPPPGGEQPALVCSAVWPLT